MTMMVRNNWRRKKYQHVVWQPQAKQTMFLSRPEYEVFYGGAAGGGKSEALVMEALRQVDIPHYRGLILRRTFKELGELIDKSQTYYKRAYPGARFNQTSLIWKFPSGSTVEFSNLKDEIDVKKYDGHQFDFVGFDELTHFTQSMYTYLMSRNRPKGPGTRVYMRSTGNPGGIGHAWVKARFVDPAPPLTPIKSTYSVTAPDGKIIEVSFNRLFVPATVFDNEILLTNDPTYIGKLAALPPKERDALLYGDWESFKGQVFEEFINNPEGYKNGLYTNVIDPFSIPGHWRIIRSFDWGYSKPFSVGWYAVDEEGIYYRIQEYYGTKTGESNTGVQLGIAQIAEKILEFEDADMNLKNKKIMGVADPSIFESSRGESIATTMARVGVYFKAADNTRIAGKMQLHNRLYIREDGRPMFYVFNTCREFIRTLPGLTYDKYRVEDVDTTGEDHIYDECRYAIMENQIARPIRLIDKPKEYSPFDDINEKEVNRFFFYKRG